MTAPADRAPSPRRSTDASSGGRSDPPTHAPPRQRWALIAAAVVVVATVGAVLRFGVARPPDLPSVAEQPEPPPPGRAAWLDHEGNEPCLRVLRPSGDITDHCGVAVAGEVTGFEDGEVVLRGWDGDAREIRIDAETGARTERAGTPDRDPLPGTGVGDLRTTRDDGSLTVEVDGVRVWRVDAPDAYDVRTALRSADGRTVLLHDEADRLLVVPADGSVPPRVWTTDVGAWTPVVWEATSRAADEPEGAT